MPSRPAMRPFLVLCVMSCAVALTACTPRPVKAPTATASPSTPSATGTSSALAAPRNLKLAGRLPDLGTPVPPGEGEAGRLTISWESAAGPTGFRIYTKDCDGTVKAALGVPAADRQFGPIHACRPTGNLGVAALYATGESAITWVR